MIESAMKAQARQNGGVVRNLTTHSTGARVSELLIVELAVAVLCARPVNSGVMSPLRIDTILIAASPLLCGCRVEWIIKRPVDARYELNQPVVKGHGIQCQLSCGSSKEIGVRRGGIVRYNITTHST